MPRIILLLLILGLAVYLIYRFRRLAPEKQKQLIKLLIIIGLAALMAILALSGRLNWLVAAIAALLPLIPRAAKFFLGLWPTILPYFRRYQENKQSSMQTRFIRLQIDVLSGELQGEVLEGNLKGQKLQLMSLEQLMQLLEECKQQDNQSAALLVAYLNRTHKGWADTASSSGDSSYYEDMPDSKMSEQQAREILGVSKSAGKDEINKAHKRLIQKMHPDRGGSDYLAQQINLAKDTLMKLF